MACNFAVFSGTIHNTRMITKESFYKPSVFLYWIVAKNWNFYFGAIEVIETKGVCQNSRYTKMLNRF